MAATFEIVITEQGGSRSAGRSGSSAAGGASPPDENVIGGGGGGGAGRRRSRGQADHNLPTRAKPFWDPLSKKYVGLGGLPSHIDPMTAFQGLPEDLPKSLKPKKEPKPQEPKEPKPKSAGPSLKTLAATTAAGIGFGGVYQDIAGIAGTTAAGAEIGGPVGAAIGAAVGIFEAATRRFADSVGTYAKYSGDVMGAQAQADVRTMLQDVKEANELGPDMATFIDGWTQLQLELRDSLVPIKAIALEVIGPLLPEIGAFLGDIAKGAGVIIEMVRGIYKALMKIVEFDFSGALTELQETYRAMKDIAQRKYDRETSNPHLLMEKFFSAFDGRRTPTNEDFGKQADDIRERSGRPSFTPGASPPVGGGSQQGGARPGQRLFHGFAGAFTGGLL